MKVTRATRASRKAARNLSGGSRKTVRAAGTSGNRKQRQSPGAGRSAAAKRSPARKQPKRWSAEVTRHSNAMDLEAGVFTLKSAKSIAASLKRSAERSGRRKAEPYRSALSMLTFYINRAGANLSATRRRLLTRAKDELRRQFGRT